MCYSVQFYLLFLSLLISDVQTIDSYPDGVLQNFNHTEIPPISDLYVFRENSSLSYHSYPVPPDCSNILDVHEHQVSATVTIWKIDQESESEWGLLIWVESITTTCTWDFWGTYKGSEMSRSSIHFKKVPSEEDIKRFWNLQENELIEFDDIPYRNRYACYWCRNEYPGTYEMTYIKKIRIVRHPDGGIKEPKGSWILISEGFFKDQMRVLYVTKLGDKLSCPFKIYDIKAGVISKTSTGNILISLPIVNLQFSVNPESYTMTCGFGKKNYELVQSLGGYLLSIDCEENNWRLEQNPKSRTKKSVKDWTSIDHTTKRFKAFIKSNNSRHKREIGDWEFSESLKTNLDYAQLRYEQNFVINQINKNFVLLQKTICDIRYQKWLGLTPPNLALKVAQYIIGNIYTIGDSHFNGYAVQHTEKTISKFVITEPIEVEKGMFKVKRIPSAQLLWAEPVTGILFKNPVLTHYSMSSDWLPGINGTAINPFNNKIMFPESDLNNLKLIEQVEASNVKNLYSNSELYGSTGEFSKYKTSGINDDDPTKGWSFLPLLSTHFVLSLVVGLLVTLIIPSLLKFVRSLCRKGEDVLENELRLKVNKNQNKRPTWN